MGLFGNGTGIDCTSIDATLKSATSDCRHIVTTHVDIVTPHEASNLQVQSEDLAHAVCIYTNRGYQTLS
jgi:hypothetical protein